MHLQSAIPKNEAKRQRRIFPRWQLSFPVRYGIGPELAHGEGCEVSEGGMVFSGELPYPLGAEIEIHLQPNSQQEKIFKVRAVIRHVAHNKMGAEFLNLGLTDRIKLLQALRAK